MTTDNTPVHTAPVTPSSSSDCNQKNPPTFLVRISIWLGAAACLYLLRSFFLLIFLTFIFGYIQAGGVRRLERKIPYRRLRVVLVTLCFLGFIVGICNFLAPKVQQQAETFAKRYPDYLHNLDNSLVEAAGKYPVLERLFPQIIDYKKISPPSSEWRVEVSASSKIFRDMLGLEDELKGPRRTTQMVEQMKDVFTRIVSSVSAFLLSLLFSFLIVWDLPGLAAGARSLRGTKIRFIYDELAPTVVSFASVLGRAFEAQLVIAFLNTFFTALGVWAIGLDENIAFFSVIVFLCSFIPVAGVFISSLPICLMALQESGFTLMLIVVLLITAIHMVETYILNPKIYGHHLRMNPVIVLILLTLGGKLFHVWGLILGVPIFTYIFGTAIKHKNGESGELNERTV